MANTSTTPVFLAAYHPELFLKDPKLETLVKLLIRPRIVVVVVLSFENPCL